MVMASVVAVTTADLGTGSAEVVCWRGAALAAGIARHPERYAAASGTKRFIVSGAAIGDSFRPGSMSGRSLLAYTAASAWLNYRPR